MKSLASGFAFLLGIVLILQGIWELVSPVVLFIFTGNMLHGIIHLVLGLLGICAAVQNRARGFCLFLGLLLLVVSGLWFLPATHGLVVRLLNINTAVTILNLTVAFLSLLVATVSRPSTP